MATSVVHKAGDLIGKYRVLGELGTGGMGVVYLVEDTTLGREVALKSIRGMLPENKALLAKLEAEARAVGKLFHPHIVPINALTHEDGVLYIEMPYLEGGSLADIMEARNLQCPEVVLYCADVLDALIACHEQGIVHRDVKPSNILLDIQGRALLGDFGVARVLGEELGATKTTQTTSVFVGTPRYAPLEAWDEKTPTPAWDLFSIGAILYEGLAGKPVFDAQSLLGYMRAMESKPAPLLSQTRPGTSESMSALVAALLESSAESRLSDARIARDQLIRTPEFEQLESVASATTIEVHRSPRLAIRKSVPRIPVRFLAGLGLTLVASLCVLSYVAWSRGVKPRGVARHSQEALLALPAYTAKDVGSAYRFPPRQEARVFRRVALPPAVETPETWLVLKQRHGSGFNILSRTDRRIATLTLEPDLGDSIAVEGIWGEYLDGLQHECANGTLSGTGRWLDEGKNLYCSVEYIAPRQGLRWKEEYTLERVEAADTEFLWALEEEPLLQRLIHGELADREPRWRELYPFWLPAIQSNFVEAQALDANGTTVELDGILDEWRGRALKGWPAALNPSLRVAASGSGLFVALETSLPFSEPEIEVALHRVLPANDNTAPPTHFILSGEAVTGDTDASAGNSTANVSGARFAQAPTAGGWACEVFVPRAPAGAAGKNPPPALYRLNVSVRELALADAGATRAIWGAPDLLDTNHGVLVRLPRPEPGRAEE